MSEKGKRENNLNWVLACLTFWIFWQQDSWRELSQETSHTRVVVAGHGTNCPRLLGSKAFNHIFHPLPWICSQYCSHCTFNRLPHHYNCDDQYHWEIIYHSLNACPPGPRRLSQRWESHYCWPTSSPPPTSTDPCFRARWHNYVISGVCLFLL